MDSHLNNQLLARLDRTTFAQIESDFKVVRLDLHHVLSETEASVQKVYFPHNGIISCVVETVCGGAIETGMIGKDGQFGAGPALHHKLSHNRVVVQVPSDVSIIDADRFRQLALEHPSLRQAVMSYEQFFLAQVQQTAACNALHNVRERTCKWLLRMQGLIGDDLTLTQEFLAQMMGVRRSSVSPIAAGLQALGLIRYSRGRIHIEDLEKLMGGSCECASAVASHYERTFPDLRNHRRCGDSMLQTERMIGTAI